MPTPVAIDCSHWNTVTDWNAVRAAGIVGVIHKATEGSDYTDPNYAACRQQALDAHLLFGAYHFLRPGDMVQQAQFFLSVAQPDSTTLLAADHEDAGVSLDDLKQFLATLRDSCDCAPVLYSGNVVKDQLGPDRDDELSQYRLWLAEYCAPPPTWPNATWPQWWLWQYDSTGSCDGVNGDVDLNAYQGDDLAGEWTGQPTPQPGPTPDVPVVQITVPPGVRLMINGVLWG